MIIAAARIFPVTSPPVDNGALLIQKGVIREIGDAPSLRRAHPGVTVQSYPDCVILPGLVNAHTHFEYSHFHRFARPTPFLPWIRKLVRASTLHRWLRGPRFWRRSAERGIRASLAAGISTVGDVVTFGGGLEAAASAGIRARIFLEAVALGPADAAKGALRVRTLLESGCWSDRLSPGISPHSVYTVGPEALAALGQLASELSLPVAVHAGETEHEISLLQGRGPLARQITRFGLPFGADFGKTLVSYLRSHGLITEKTLLVHGTHLSEEDLEKSKQLGVSLATCPRSNLTLGTGLPDYRLWERLGIPFGYGTDSLASVPGFDLFEEARMVRRHLPEEGTAVLRRLTLGGAEILGLEGRTGSLETGKEADLVALRMDEARDCDAEDVATEGSAARVAATWVGGDILYNAPSGGGSRSPDNV